MKLYLKSREVAEMLGLSIKTIQRLIRERQIPSCRIGGSTRVPSDALEKRLKRNTRRPS